MGLGFSHHRFFGGLGCLLLGAMPLRSEPDPAGHSPFLPPGGAAAPAAVTQGAPIELRGVMVTPEGMLFSIYDPVKKSATWLGLNETGRNYVVRQHQSVGGNDQVTVEYMGNTLTLSLKATKIAAGPANSFPSQNTQSQPSPALTQTVVMNPTPADQAARLQAVAEEVQRRRALRQRAPVQGAGGGYISPTPPGGPSSGPNR